ncbi:conserved protein of unknown function [Pararobbsia alpina]
MLKSTGMGVAYLGPGDVRLRFPSWRATFGRRLAMVVLPVRSFWPMAAVGVFESARENSMRDLMVSADQLARSMRRARPILMAVSAVVVFAIPSWLLVRGADRVFLVLACLAYLMYVGTTVVLMYGGGDEDRRRLAKHWRVLLEPLLCLPFGTRLFRNLSEHYRLTVPLVDVLRSATALRLEDLQDLRVKLEDHRIVTDDLHEIAHIATLQTLIGERLGEMSK